MKFSPMFLLIWFDVFRFVSMRLQKLCCCHQMCFAFIQIVPGSTSRRLLPMCIMFHIFRHVRAETIMPESVSFCEDSGNEYLGRWLTPVLPRFCLHKRSATAALLIRLSALVFDLPP